MNAYPIGTSALIAGRRGMDLVGQNIANATTPGYRRQTLYLSSRTTGADIGTGVAGNRLVRYTAPPVRTAILTGNADESAVTSRLDTRRQVETALGQGENTIGAKLEQFFNRIERLSTRPSDSAVRREAVSVASDLATQFNSVAQDIDRLAADINRQTTQAVDDVNSLTSQIAELNGRIYNIEARGEQANDLMDQRDQLIDDLSKKVDLRTVNMDNGVVNVIARDITLVVSDSATKLATTANAPGQIEVTVAGETQPLQFDGGYLGGMMREHNQDLPATRARLDALAAELVRNVDKFQATGLGLDGPLASVVGARGVTDPTQPLATQNLPVPMTAGTLTFSITNTTTLARTTAAIAIDPATMSLNDVAAAITAGTGGQVQATVDTPQNVLRFQAQTGFAFDFAGRPDSPPAAVFAPPTVADTDTGAVLASLGVNGIFQGSGASDLRVRPEIVADPNRFAASRSGRSGDSDNLNRLATVRDQAVFGGRTLGQEYTDIAASVGVQVSSLSDQQTAQAGILQDLNAQEQAVSGVNMDEELVNLLTYQRMVEGASRFLSVVNSAMDSILEMTR
jgi:flagellar hook-associated protein FlgK